MKRTSSRGFTLIELLIAIILMVILMGSITVIFMTSSDTVMNSQALAKIYKRSWITFDQMVMDLQSCVPFNKGVQRFIMENGMVDAGGGNPAYAAGTTTAEPQLHLGKAADRITFRAIVPIDDVHQVAEVTYELKPETVGPQKTVRDPQRPIYVLKRKVMKQNAATGLFDVYDSKLDREWCHGVISFNLEYYDNTMKFSQLEPSPFPPSDPLGDGAGTNDTTTPYRVPQIRVTLTLVEDEQARRERPFFQVIHIPVGY